MVLQKRLCAAFPLVTMEKLFMLLLKPNSSTCWLCSSPYWRRLPSTEPLFPTPPGFHLSQDILVRLKKHPLDSTSLPTTSSILCALFSKTSCLSASSSFRFPFRLIQPSVVPSALQAHNALLIAKGNGQFPVLVWPGRLAFRSSLSHTLCSFAFQAAVLVFSCLTRSWCLLQIPPLLPTS